jgi:prolyl oligopeptidase
MLNNVKSELYKFTWKNGWKRKKSMRPNLETSHWVQQMRTATNSFSTSPISLEPSTLYSGDAATGEIKKIKIASLFLSRRKLQGSAI